MATLRRVVGLLAVSMVLLGALGLVLLGSNVQRTELEHVGMLTAMQEVNICHQWLVLNRRVGGGRRCWGWEGPEGM